MDSFMNPQKSQRRSNVDNRAGEWSFVESALIARHAPEVGPNPIRITCPSCSKQILTQIESETYSKTHFCAAALIMTIVCCPMIWLPYAVDTWKKKHHYCPSCRQYLGTYMG